LSRNPYETEQYLEEYLLFHYGHPADLCPFDFVPRELLLFHERLRKECIKPLPTRRATRALDIGCGVGRFTFELGRVADEVLGIDNSHRFIGEARRIARGNSATLRIRESGAILKKHRVALPKPLRAAAVRFKVGDALNLMPFCDRPFDIVAAINLLCRLPAPDRFLQKLCAIVAPGGQLILASPYSWLEQFTPRREWLTSKQVEQQLRRHFRVAHRCDLPLLIREHRRKYQLVISEVTTFIRTSSGNK
jgi:putative 4-mercaptohistidine N1-methyltranferase